MQSRGNTADFGDLQDDRDGLTAVSTSTRGVWAGGYDGTRQNRIDYVTITTAGDATDFGDLTEGRNQIGGASSSTRGKR